jgi:hypothetical protein
MSKYYKNANGVVVKGEIKREVLIKKIIDEATGELLITEKGVLLSLYGEVVIDDNYLYGIGEKIKVSVSNDWVEISYEEIEDIL